MKTKEIIESNVQDISFGYIDKETDEFVEINHENLDAVAKKFGCSPDLLELIWSTFKVITQATHDDLADIWEKLD